MALSLKVLLIHARNRFSSPFLSVSEGCRSIGRACWQLLGNLCSCVFVSMSMLLQFYFCEYCVV